MTYKRFKIHPAPLALPKAQEQKPKLDPSKAPWSSPRGFATSIPEEVSTYKQTVRSQKPPPKSLLVRARQESKQKSNFSWKAFFKKPFVAIYNHFQVITFSEERHDHINTRMHKFIGYICCIRADVNAAIAT